MAFVDQSRELGSPPSRLERQPDVYGPSDRAKTPNSQRAQMPSLDHRDGALADTREFRDVELAKAPPQPYRADCSSDPNVFHCGRVADGDCVRITCRLPPSSSRLSD